MSERVVGRTVEFGALMVGLGLLASCIVIYEALVYGI